MYDRDGSGECRFVSHGTGRSTGLSLLDYVSSLRATRPRAVGSTLETSTRVHAPSIEPTPIPTPTIEPTPTPTPTIEPTPTIPPAPMFRFRLESRGDSHEPPHAREHRLVGALARVGGVRRVYPHAPHHQQRGLPSAVRRRHFLHGHARRLERFSDRAATEAGVVFAPNPRGRRLRPHPQIRARACRRRRRRVARSRPPRFPSLRRGVGILAEELEGHTSSRSRTVAPGVGADGRRRPAATRRGRGGERADAAGRASPGERVQGLFAPADDLDALHGVTGDDAQGADRLRGGDCGDFGGREGRVKICGSEEYSASFR